VENYYRKVISLELDVAHPNTALEDKEKWNLDRETYLDSLNEYMKVERIISAQDGDDDTEYYVKWKGLPYDFCTWEPAALISELAQTEIDRYLDRTSKMPTTNQREASLATRSDYKPFRTQPDYIKGGELREFQIHGLNFLAHHWCKGNNVILADEMGLGKTVQTVSFIDWLKHERGQQGPFIVVVPLSTMPAWADTFDNWTPDINYVVYNGNEEARKIIREYELLVDPRNYKKVKFNVLLTTYEYVLADAGFLSQLKWQFMAVDEAHRLKNRDSQLYAKLMEFGAPSRLLITGTPMQNTLSELSALMDFLMPGKVKVDEEIDLISEHASEKIAELTNAISPYMIRRTKAKVEGDLPPKTEKIIRVELADVQLEYYKNILTRNYTALNAGSKGQKASLLNIMMELKKASNHAFMFPNAEERILEGTSGSREEQLKALITSSGKMMLLDQLLTKMKKDGHRVLIFSQMVKMLDLLGDYLNLRGHQFQRLDGTIAAGARRMAIDHFNAPNSQDFCFLLSTRAGGLGINLMTADTVILFDSDWNPQADLQAMARAHRIGQKKPVTIYRLVSKDTVEEEVLERARNKLMLEFITIQRGVTDKDNTIMKEKLARAGEKAIEPTSSDEISRILKKRGQKMFEQTNNQRKLEELDIDAVLENAEEHRTEQPEGMTTDGGEEFLRSFEYTDVKVDLEWDQIIPQAELDKIKEEERKKEEEAYLESVIEANQPRKRKAPVDEAREQRAAKKRARDLAAEAAADIGSDDDDDDTDRGRDPKRPLGEKECRNLIRSYERFGAFEEKPDEIVREARLLSRDIDVVRDTLQAVVDEADRLLKAESDRLAELERTTGKQVTKKERKTVLYDFRGVKRINAETIRERPIDMRMIRELVGQVKDPRNFRIPEASKPASYTCEWGAREDGMLTVGIARHGMGAWAAIRDDPDLDMGHKMFLEEHRVGQKEEREKSETKTTKSPGAVHLVRRAGYLVSVLRDKTSGGANSQARRAMENHHRNNRKHVGSFHGRFGTPNGSASPAPGHHRKGRSNDRHQSDIRNSLDRRPRDQGSPNGHRKISTEDRERIRERQAQQPRPGHQRVNSSPMANGSNAKPLSEHDKKLQHVLAPMNEHLARASGANKKKIPDDMTRLKLIKVSLVAIGNHITNHPHIKQNASLEDSLWEFVSNRHWPQSTKESKRVSGKKLKEMYVKIAGKDAAPKTTAPREPAKPASNGDGAPAVKQEAKKDPSPDGGDKPMSVSPVTVKGEDKMEVDTKSPA
jgi:chromodomain-helicase-DNA-binding protein 1